MATRPRPNRTRKVFILLVFFAPDLAVEEKALDADVSALESVQMSYGGLWEQMSNIKENLFKSFFWTEGVGGGGLEGVASGLSFRVSSQAYLFVMISEEH